MSKQESGKRYAARGRRYSPAQRAEILNDAEEIGVAGAAEKHGCSAWSIYEWRKKAARRSGESASGQQPGRSERDERHRLILELWRQQPGLGPSQIRSLLKRRGFRASVSTVRAIMEEQGYVHPKLRRKEHTGRYEAVRPLQLVRLDFYHFHVHRQRQCQLLILDDFSRFITGFCLLKSEHANGTIAAFEESVARYGRPESVMTDRGSAFHSNKGVSRFERLLEELEINHCLAREPAVNGKSEALNAAVQKEMVRQIEFVDLTDAHRHVAGWVRFYKGSRI